MLYARGLRTRLGSFALDVAEFTASAVTVVLGRNGSGKTVFLKSLAGIVRARGEVWACGRDVSALPPERRGLAYIPTLPPDMPARPGRLLLDIARRHGTQGEVEGLVEALGISGLLDSRHLSTGQRQLVYIAGALLARPCAILMDEPTAHLDWPSRRAMLGIVRAIGAGTPVVYVTHDPLEALSAGDRICLMEGGRLGRCVDNRPRDLWGELDLYSRLSG